jgi:hypothetical protein
MTLRVPRSRTLAPLLVAAAALLAWSGTATAARGAATVDKGVVQEISETAIVLRALDGSTVTLALGPATTYKLNGRPAALADLRPGLVAAVTHNGSRPARVVRAFGAVTLVEEGVVESATRSELTLRRADGTLVTIGVGPETKVRKFGRPARRAAIRPGLAARVTYAPGAPAKLVALMRPLR